MKYRVHWVSGNPNNNVCQAYLEREGWEIRRYSYDCDLLLDQHERPDLWILNVEGVAGLTVLGEIRKDSASVGVLLTGEPEKLLAGFLEQAVGWNDFAVTPWTEQELLLRAKRIMAQCDIRTGRTGLLQIQDFWLDTSRHMALYHNQYVDLTLKEFNLLFLLAQNQGFALSRQQIIRYIWGETYVGSDRVVDDLIRRIRKKVASFEVETLYGYGYRLKMPISHK